MSDSTIRVLVFGGTGTGKTSLCNTLTGRSRPTGNGALGVTAKSHLYNAFEYEGRNIRLFDTVGLHESSFGTVPAEQAFAQVVELLTRAKEGFSLMIHVARASRITKEQEDDYKFFVEKLTQEKIPVLLVLTGCENEDPMTAWLDRNRDSYGRFHYKDMIPTCFLTGGKFEAHFALLRAQSAAKLLEAILANALPEPHRLYGRGTGSTFGETLTRVWNYVVDWTGLPAKWRGKVNESAFELIKRLGLPEEVAKLATRHIPDLVEELASKLPLPGAGKAAKFGTQQLLKMLFGKSA
jgi:hypothetical protein